MSVEFDPVPLGRPRRRTDPVVIVVMVILAGLALAILKPWDRGPHRSDAVAVASARASAAATVVDAVPAPAATPGPKRPAQTALSWETVRRVQHAAPSFAVDLVTVDWSGSTGSAGYPEFFEAWDTRPAARARILETSGRSVVGLGVTTDRRHVVQDVRIWRVRANGDLDWVDANPIAGTVPGGPLVLAIPGEAIAFPAGRYRIDALVDGGIQRIDVAIPGSTGSIPPLSDTLYPTVTGLVPLVSTDPSAVVDGPFAAVDGEGWALRAVPVDPLTETGAWVAKPRGPRSWRAAHSRARLPAAGDRARRDAAVARAPSRPPGSCAWRRTCPSVRSRRSAACRPSMAGRRGSGSPRHMRVPGRPASTR